MSKRDRVYICVTRQEACEISAGLWVAARLAARDAGDKILSLRMMEIMCDVADAIDSYDRRIADKAATLDSILSQVTDGLAAFPPYAVEWCKDS